MYIFNFIWFIVDIYSMEKIESFKSIILIICFFDYLLIIEWIILILKFINFYVIFMIIFSIIIRLSYVDLMLFIKLGNIKYI